MLQESAVMEPVRSEVEKRDITFHCPACGKSLVVDRAGEGMEVPCPVCATQLTIPPFPGDLEAPPQFDFSGLTPDDVRQRLELAERKLKENQSQRTEVQGHINLETIQLHRRQLQLDRLVRKQRELEAQIGALRRAKGA